MLLPYCCCPKDSSVISEFFLFRIILFWAPQNLWKQDIYSNSSGPKTMALGVQYWAIHYIELYFNSLIIWINMNNVTYAHLSSVTRFGWMLPHKSFSPMVWVLAHWLLLEVITLSTTMFTGKATNVHYWSSLDVTDKESVIKVCERFKWNYNFSLWYGIRHCHTSEIFPYQTQNSSSMVKGI